MYRTSVLTPCKARCGTFLTNEQLLEMLKSNFFRAKNFNVFYNWRAENFSGKARARTNCTEKFSARNGKFSARNGKFSYLRGKTTAILGQKRGENPVFAGFLLFAIQIYKIFLRKANRLNISQRFMKCEKTRFAAASPSRVLYYEGRKGPAWEVSTTPWKYPFWQPACVCFGRHRRRGPRPCSC